MKILIPLLFIITTGPAIATIIDFDTLPDGTALGHNVPITDQFQTLGVLFSGENGPAHTFKDLGEATTKPNILVGDDNFGDLSVSFVNTSSGLASTANNVSVNAISVGWAEWTVTSKDLAGDILEQFVLQNPTGPVNGLANVDPISFTIDGIASIDFIFTVDHAGDGIGIDDLTFNLASVPEPSIIALFAAGFFGIGFVRRRQS